ncbi:TPA: helix-turn-helix domain-containing protein [Streptococcus suis]|nr:helix-turn-helix domain-containing protein [Streptococcus suis]
MDESQRKQIWKMRAEGLGYGLIGRATGLSRDSVKKYCKRNPALLGHGAATKLMAKADQNDGLRCPQCYQALKIHKTGRPKKFCSDKCRKVWWTTHFDEHDKSKTAYEDLTCQQCGRSFLSYANPNRKFCSHSCYIQSRFYKGETNDKSTNNGN